MRPIGAARIGLAALLALSAACPAGAFVSNAGGSGAQFLRLGAGARALGLGEAYGPVAEGPEAVYWNPAGLARLERPEFAYAHAEMLRFFHHDFMAYAHPSRMLGGTVAGAATLFYQDSLAAVNNANVEVGSFRPQSLAVSLAYARAFFPESAAARDRAYFERHWYSPWVDRPLHAPDYPWQGALMAGAAVKLVRESLKDRSASALAVDGGVLYSFYELPRLSFSLALRNAGGKLRFIREPESLPAELAAGAAYDARWGERRLLMAAEVTAPYYGAPHANLGAEYSVPAGERSRWALRAGFRTLPAGELGVLAGVTLGVGLQHRSLSVDFGFEPMAQLGQAYRFGVNWRF